MKRVILAMQLLTRLPIKKQYPDAVGADYAGSVLWFFLPALLCGLLMAAVYIGVLFAGIPYLAAFACVIAAYLFTGGLHIDGFADMCDAFFARKSKERTLEILKDSRMGTYGVIAIVFVVAVKTLAIASFAPEMVWTLAAVPLCGKIALVVCAAVSSYPREDGLGKYIVEELPVGTAILSIVFCAVGVCFFAGVFRGLIAIGLMALCGLILAQVSKRKIGGATGDILGAANEAGEMAFLILAGVLF